MKKSLRKNLLFVGVGRVCASIVNEIKDLPLINKIYLKGRGNLNKKDLQFCKNFENEFAKIDIIVISLSGQTPEMRRKNIKNYNTNQKIREAELDVNIIEINTIFGFLKMFSDKIPIIIITNPVDVITNLLRVKRTLQN